MSPRSPAIPWPLLAFWFRRYLFTWVLLTLLIFLVQIMICGVMQDNERVRAILNLLDMMPSFMKAAIGGEELQVGNRAALVAIGYQHPLVLICFMVFAVALPTGMLTGEQQSGAMELLLGRLLSRRQVYGCAALLTMAGLVASTQVMFLGTVVGVRLFLPAEAFDLAPFYMTAVTGILLAASAGAVALLAAAVCRRRSAAVGLAVGFLMSQYFIALLGAWWPPMAWVAPLSIISYIDPHEIMRTAAWPWRDMIVLASFMILTTLAGLLVWQRRDLPA